MLLALAIVTAVASTMLLYGGTMIGQDSATQFYPWYDYLGERLRGGEVPAWNPYQFAGAPFAADPQSGWTYLPAMLVFTLLPLSLAVPVFLVGHLTIAGFGTYALARVLRILPGGAFVAAVAYQLSGPILGRSVCCPAALEVATWFPIALLGAELAIRQQDWTRRTVGWVVAGLAVSQALAAWLGQGAYYLLLGLGAFVVYRTVLVPHDPSRRMFSRFADAGVHGSAILTIGFGLAAAGVAPRLDYVARSNVAGGEYQEQSAWAAEIGGVTPGMIVDRFFDPSLHYPGIAVLDPGNRGTVDIREAGTRCAISPGSALPRWCLRRRGQHRCTCCSTPCSHGLRNCISTGPNVSLSLGSWLSRCWPEQRSTRWSGEDCHAVRRWRWLGYRSLVLRRRSGSNPVHLCWRWLDLAGRDGDDRPRPRSRSLAPLGDSWSSGCVVAIDLLLGFHGISGQAPYGGFHRVDIGTYFAPTGAVEVLRKREIAAPGRYIGFDQDQRAIADGQMVLYRYQFASPETGALLVNNRGTLHDLEDAQGYNPVQPLRFVEYLTALNGRPQEYHDANVYPVGIKSPLLDLLHVALHHRSKRIACGRLGVSGAESGTHDDLRRRSGACAGESGSAATRVDRP